MSNNTAMYGQNYSYCMGMQAPAASDVEPGDALQYDRTGTWGLLMKQPVTANLLKDFAGIAVKGVLRGEKANQALATMGVVPCKFKNHASAAAWSYCTPVNAQDYLTYSATPTNIILLTDQTDGTAEHGPNSTSPPVVMLLPNTGLQTIKSVQVEIEAIGTASSDWVVIPEKATIIGAYAVTEAAITDATSEITFELGGTAITGMGISCTVAGAAIGKVYTATAPTALNLVAAGGAVEVVNDGGATAGGKTMVTILYVPY